MLVKKPDFFNQFMKDAAAARMGICLVIKSLDRDADAAKVCRNQRTRKFLCKRKPVCHNVNRISNAALCRIGDHVGNARMKQRLPRPGEAQHLQGTRELCESVDACFVEAIVEHDLARNKAALLCRNGMNTVRTGKIAAIDGKNLHREGRIQRQHVGKPCAFSAGCLPVDTLRPHLRNSSMRARIASASSSR